MKNQTKRIFSTAAVCLFMVAAAAMSGCHKDMKDDIDDLKGEVSKLQKEVTTLSELAKTLDESLKAGKLISGTPESITEGDKTGYLIKFTDGSSIKVWNGTNGSAGTDSGLTITQNENGTITFTINDNGTEKSYTLPMNFIYPSGIVVRGTTFTVTEGQAITVPFRVNPSEAVIQEADVQLDAISGRTRSFDVVKPENFQLVAGSFKANANFVGEYSVDILCVKAEADLEAALVIDTQDAEGNAMQVSSSVFELSINNTIFTPNSLNAIEPITQFSSETADVDLTFSWNGKDNLVADNLTVTPVNPADVDYLTITSADDGKFTVALNAAGEAALAGKYPYTVELKVVVTQTVGAKEVTSTQNMTITFKSNEYTVNLTETPEWVLTPIAANTPLFAEADIMPQIKAAFGDNVTAAQIHGAGAGVITTTVQFKQEADDTYGNAVNGVSATATANMAATPTTETYKYAVLGTEATVKGFYKVTSTVVFTLTDPAEEITVNIVSEFQVADDKPYAITAPAIENGVFTFEVAAANTAMDLTQALAGATVKVNDKAVASGVTYKYSYRETGTNGAWSGAALDATISQPADPADFGKTWDVQVTAVYNTADHTGDQVTINGGTNTFTAKFQRNLLTKVDWLLSVPVADRNFAFTVSTTPANVGTYNIANLIGFIFANEDQTALATYTNAAITNDWLVDFAEADIVFEDTNAEKYKQVNGTEVTLKFTDWQPTESVTTKATITFTDVFGTKKTFEVPVTITPPASN